jgi:hypothetical protein
MVDQDSDTIDPHTPFTDYGRPLSAAAAGVAVVMLFTAVAAAAEGRPDLSGVWKSALTSQDDPRWRIEDLACLGWCSMAGFEYLQRLLKDPANETRHIKDLIGEMEQRDAERTLAVLTPLAREELANYDPSDDPAVDCTPDGDGWRHQLTAPPPIEITQYEDRVVIRYEYWNAERIIYTDGRGHPDDVTPSRLGHSIGWYEGPTLVVETTAIIPSLVSLPGGYVTHSPDARAYERYTRNGDRLDLEWSIVDPVYFREPIRGYKSHLSAPGWKLEEFVCEAITGEY